MVLNGEGCVAKKGIFHRVRTIPCFLARDLSPWQLHMMTSNNWRRAVEGQTISHHLKSGAIWMIFIGVTASSCFLASDTLPWQPAFDENSLLSY